MSTIILDWDNNYVTIDSINTRTVLKPVNYMLFAIPLKY